MEVSTDYLYIGDTVGRFFVVQLPSGSPVRTGQSSLCSTCGQFSITSITVDPDESSTIYATIGSYGDYHLWKSTDNGNTWAKVGNSLPDVPANTLVILPGTSTMYLGTDLGVLYSQDSGLTHRLEELELDIVSPTILSILPVNVCYSIASVLKIYSVHYI
jgi:hypothetical protein